MLYHRSNNIEVNGSKENNDILVSSYVEISIYNIIKKLLSNYIYYIIKYEYELKKVLIIQKV